LVNIENRGWIGLFKMEGNAEVEITDPELVRRLSDQLLFDEDLADFLQDGSQEEQALYYLGVRSGTPRVAFNERTQSIACVITYTSPRTLTAAESQILSNYSNDQLTDGFGSNPIYMPAIGEGYFVHLGPSEA